MYKALIIISILLNLYGHRLKECWKHPCSHCVLSHRFSNLVVQWNYLLYMLPTRTFWGFLFFFLILVAFFLDIKMLLVSGLACMISLFIGWFIRGTDLMPVKDELFLTDIIMCLVALVLSLTGLAILFSLLPIFW